MQFWSPALSVLGVRSHVPGTEHASIVTRMIMMWSGKAAPLESCEVVAHTLSTSGHGLVSEQGYW